MIAALRYRGLVGHISYSEEDGSYVGHIHGVQDIVGFHGQNEAELQRAFQAAVEDYLEIRRQLVRE